MALPSGNRWKHQQTRDTSKEQWDDDELDKVPRFVAKIIRIRQRIAGVSFTVCLFFSSKSAGKNPSLVDRMSWCLWDFAIFLLDLSCLATCTTYLPTYDGKPPPPRVPVYVTVFS